MTCSLKRWLLYIAYCFYRNNRQITKPVDVCMDRPKKLCYVYIVKDNCILPQIIVETHETPCQGLRIKHFLGGEYTLFEHPIGLHMQFE
jgi:hypothetical protein